jgi:hypothetical protein
VFRAVGRLLPHVVGTRRSLGRASDDAEGGHTSIVIGRDFARRVVATPGSVGFMSCSNSLASKGNIAGRNLVPLLEVPEYRPWATVRWLRRQVNERRIGYYKAGGRVLLDLAELDSLVERGRADPVEPVKLRATRR